jgi:hypothetical protein
MNTSFAQSFRLWISGRSWRKMVLAAALPAWLALGAGHALAQPAVGGQDTFVNIGIPANGCTTLNQQIFAASNLVRYCVATGSADVLHPAGNGGTYVFNLTLDNAACAPLNGGMERTVQFADVAVGAQVIRDNRIKEVTSTGFFTLTPNVAHILRWTGRAPGAPATIVDDRSLSVVCLNQRLLASPIPD